MARGRRSNIGDTRVSPNGYHYTRQAEGWKLTHQVLVEKHLGRKLRPNERIRYIDGNRTNLTIENLQVYTARTKSNEQRIAALRAKRDEIDAQIRHLEDEERESSSTR